MFRKHEGEVRPVDSCNQSEAAFGESSANQVIMSCCDWRIQDASLSSNRLIFIKTWRLIDATGKGAVEGCEVMTITPYD